MYHSRKRSVLQQAVIEKYGSRLHASRFDPKPYRFDPIRYIRDCLKWEPWQGSPEHPGQIEILECYARILRQMHEKREYDAGRLSEAQLTVWCPGEDIKNWIRVQASHNVGKCVAASEYLTLGDGSRVKAADLIGQEFTLPTILDGRVVPVRARAELNAIAEPVLRLETQSGKVAVRNAQHPFWVAKATFRTGATPRIAQGAWTPLREIRVGDVVAVPDSLPIFGDGCGLSEIEIKTIAYLLGDGGYSKKSIRFTQMAGPQLTEFTQCATSLGCKLTFREPYDWDVNGVNGRGKHRNNPILNLLRKHGMMSTHSRDKRVPAAMFKATKDQLRLFLSRLYSTDGWACRLANTSHEIGFCSASERLIRDVQVLLLRFGVHAKIYRKPKVNAWVAFIRRKDDVETFCREIGIFGKEPQVAKALEHALAGHRRTLWTHDRAPAGTRWERVVSVESDGIQPTIAVEVPGPETFAHLFWEHNTRLASGIVNHFFDSFAPSITYAIAPSYPQIHDLLFKEIKATREGKGLPGKPMDLRLERSDDHFVVGRATSDSGGTGIEKIQGQHSEHMLLALDEGEGIEPFVYKAVDKMSSGGFCIVVVLANPRTRTSEFHKRREKPEVHNFTISALHHPNVLSGREIIPGSVTRQAVDRILDDPQCCLVVESHNSDHHTFEVPWRPGVIFKPLEEALLELLGLPPDNTLERIFIPEGRYDEACKREPLDDDPSWARIGIDVARDGLDKGTVWVRHAGRVWRHGDRISHENTNQYGGRVKEICQDLAAKGVKNVHVRIDWGGGYGGGVGDRIEEDPDIKGLFTGEGKPESEGWGFKVVPVQFGSNAMDRKNYDNKITELYAEAAETLKGIRVDNPPPELKTDLCERRWDWINSRGKQLRALEPKDRFRGRHGRSPDDGDGFCLCVAPDHVFVFEWAWA